MTHIRRELLLGFLIPFILCITLSQYLYAQIAYTNNDTPEIYNGIRPHDQTLKMISLKDLLGRLHQQYQLRFVFNDQVIKGVELPASLLRKKSDQLIAILAESLQVEGLKLSQIGSKQYGITSSLEKEGVISSGGSAKVIQKPDQVHITGAVKDDMGNPLVGVTIKVQGGSTGTVTDKNGKFTLDVAPTDSLVVSYVGYQTQFIPVDGRKQINIILTASVSRLNQLVVVGYGTQQKEKVTSAISEIDTRDLKDLPVTSTSQLMQGRISGVNIKTNGGAPGAPPTIQIHGISSINAGVTPLVIIDGIPVGNGIPQSLNPNDIENITVLKDAASTSIYGARGSNGVILIQTKRATASAMTIDYNVSAGFQYVPKNWQPPVLNARQYAQYNKERVEELNKLNNTNNPVPEVFMDVLNNPGKYGEGTDWRDAFFRRGTDAFFQKHNLTLRAGSEKVKGVMSAGYLNQDGVIPNTNFKRYSLSSKLDFTFSDWLKAGMNLSASRTNRRTQPIAGMWGVVFKATVASPIQSPYDKDGDLIPYLPADAPGYFAFTNPLYETKVQKDEIVEKDVLGGIYLDAEIIKGLHYKPRIYARFLNREENTFVPSTIGKNVIGTPANLAPGAPPFANSASNAVRNLNNWGMDNLLSYDKVFGDHSFKILVGYAAQKQSGTANQISAKDFPTDDHLNYLEASEVSAQISDYTNWALSAFFGRINYDYKGKYLAEVNFRREGSSKFGKNNKYGNFPSASVGWIVSKERFYPEGFFMNGLKVRASYGKTGNSAIGDFDRFGRIISIPNLNNLDNNYNYVLNDAIVVGKGLTTIGNPNLKWETSKQLDVGLNLSFLKNRVNVKVDYYRKVTEDMLFNISLPQATGFSSMRINAGQMVNKGWDFEVNSTVGRDAFSWNSGLSVSLLHNEVTYIPPQLKKINASEYNITKVGEPVGSLYGYYIEGIFNTEAQLENLDLYGWTPSSKGLGAFIYKDVNGDSGIDARDRTIIGNPHPHVILGFNNSFNYKNISLSVLATGAFGYEIISEKNEWLYNEKGRWNTSRAFVHRWKSPENPGNGIIPAIYYAGQHNYSNIWTESGNHVWIKNITLGYRIAEQVLKRIKYIAGLRVYLSVQNAFRFTHYSGWNPEVSTMGGTNPQTMGVDNFSYPVYRTYTMGIGIDF